MPQNKKMISILVITIYFLLLVPYAIISNAGETGIVIDNQEIDVNILPDDLKDLLIYKRDFYNLILIEYPIAEVTKLKGQSTKEKKLVLSKEAQEKGIFVRVADITTDIYVTSYDIINQPFEKLIIGDVKKAELGGIVEILNYYDLSLIFTLSKIDFLAGGLLVVLILTFLLHRTIALWNIPAVIGGYSFQLFLVNLIAYMNGLELNYINLLFGLLFIPALPLTFKLKTFEETKEGKQKIYELYIKNKKILLKIKSRFGM